MRKLIFTLLLAACIPFSLAALENIYAENAANLIGSPLQPLAELLGPVIVKLSLLVGGIFGLYIILILLRVYYERKNMKLLQHIRYNLDQQNQHYGIPSSREKIGFLHKYVVDKLFPRHLEKHYLPFNGKREKRKASPKSSS